jgi:hypothetical protein
MQWLTAAALRSMKSSAIQQVRKIPVRSGLPASAANPTGNLLKDGPKNRFYTFYKHKAPGTAGR